MTSGLLHRLLVPAWTGAALVVLAAAGIAAAQEMPSPRQMSGVPLPAGDVPLGTVTVRVIRGTFANPISSQTVEIVGTGSPVTASTNEIGRAEFKGLAPGARVKAAATVAGERIESQEFVVPRTGGIRLILVASGGEPATTPGAAPAAPAAPPAPAVPAQPGSVVLGDESRFVFEMGEDGLSVFYVLQVRNAASTPVQPASPLIFDLPADARSATVLDGSSPQAKVAGRRLQIDGPFAPGATNVQLAYTMPFKGSELAIGQKLPAQLTHLAVVAQKVGDMRLASPQLAEQRDMPAQGNLYIAGRGGAVAAGDTLRFQFSGMPHHATWPRTLAIALALVVLGGGAWAAWRAGGAQARQSAERQVLEANRERLFDELTALEVRHKSEAIDPARYAERRRELVAALERVYVALDDEVAVGRAS
jgi:hypothetical protein